MNDIEAPGTDTIAQSRQSVRVMLYGLHGALVVEGTETQAIHAYIPPAAGDESTACNLRPIDKFGWMVLGEMDFPVELTLQTGGLFYVAQVEARASSPITVADEQPPSDWSPLEVLPEVHYDTDTVKWWRFYTPWIQEAIDRGVALARRHSVWVERVHVSRFVSVEDEGYEECVVSFYSNSSRSNLLAFSPVLAEQLGSWRNGQSGYVPEEIGSLLSFEILPLEFWRDVRS